MKCQQKQVQWKATKTAVSWNTSCEERLNTLGLFSLEKALEHLVSNFQYLKLDHKNDEARLFNKVHGGRATSTVIWEVVNMY